MASSRADEVAEILAGAVGRMDVVVVGDVVAVVAHRRRIERQKPDRVDPELLNVVELVRQSMEIADAILVRIKERLDVQLVDDRVLVPERIVTKRGTVLQRSRGKRGRIHSRGRYPK